MLSAMIHLYEQVHSQKFNPLVILKTVSPKQMLSKSVNGSIQNQPD